MNIGMRDVNKRWDKRREQTLQSAARIDKLFFSFNLLTNTGSYRRETFDRISERHQLAYKTFTPLKGYNFSEKAHDVTRRRDVEMNTTREFQSRMTLIEVK